MKSHMFNPNPNLSDVTQQEEVMWNMLFFTAADTGLQIKLLSLKHFHQTLKRSHSMICPEIRDVLTNPGLQSISPTGTTYDHTVSQTKLEDNPSDVE